MKKIISIVAIVIIAISSVFFYLYISNSSTNILEPKNKIPSHTYQNSMETDDVATSMLKDMYPNDEIEYKGNRYSEDKSCQNKWCIFLTANGVRIFRKDGNENDSEKSAQIRITKHSQDEVNELENDYNVFYNTHIFKNYPNAKGKEYRFNTRNGLFLIDNSSIGYDVSIDYNEYPIGFKKSLPFKAYFEKIEFED